MEEEIKVKKTRRNRQQMAEFRAEQAVQKIEEAIEEVIPELYICADTNRMRLYLIKNDNQLAGCSIQELRFNGYNFQTRKFAGCKIADAIFENCNFQGCNWSGVIGGTGNTFINCELQYGTFPKGFFEDNDIIGGRVK